MGGGGARGGLTRNLALAYTHARAYGHVGNHASALPLVNISNIYITDIGHAMCAHAQDLDACSKLELVGRVDWRPRRSPRARRPTEGRAGGGGLLLGYAYLEPAWDIMPTWQCRCDSNLASCSLLHGKLTRGVWVRNLKTGEWTEICSNQEH